MKNSWARSARASRALFFSLFFGAWLVTNPATAWANDNLEFEDMSDLPVLACSELYTPNSGVLSYEDVGFAHALCVYDTPAGAVVFSWTEGRFGFSQEQIRTFQTPEELVSFMRASESSESFGAFYYWARENGNPPNFSSYVDTGSPEWGIHFRESAQYMGSAEAITQVVEATEVRLEYLNAARAVQESPEYNQQLWDLSAPDCADIWDSAGLDPAYELATRFKTEAYLECVVVESGQNPFAFDSYPIATFSFQNVCDDPAFAAEVTEQLAANYRLRQEESFGLFYFDFYGLANLVLGENTELQGEFVDQENCTIYFGWPEAISRMVSFRAESESANGAKETESDSILLRSFSGDSLEISLPDLGHSRSLWGAAAGSVLAVGFLLLKNVLARRSPHNEGHDNPESLNEDRLGVEAIATKSPAAPWFVFSGATIGMMIVVTFVDPAFRASVLRGTLEGNALVEHLVLWVTPLLLLVAVAAIASLPRGELKRSKSSSAFTALALGLVILGAIGTGWPLTAGVTIPALLLLIAAAPGRKRPNFGTHRTLWLWIFLLLGLGLWTVLGVTQEVDLLPDWATQMGLITLGMLATSVAVMALPMRNSWGHVSLTEHPWMWAGAMALSWWMLIAVAGPNSVVTLSLTAIAIFGVAITHLRIFRRPRATPSPEISLPAIEPRRT